MVLPQLMFLHLSNVMFAISDYTSLFKIPFDDIIGLMSNDNRWHNQNSLQQLDPLDGS